MTCDGTKLVALRKKAMMTQDKLAAMAMVSERTIQRMEAGKAVSLETLHQVAAPLCVTANELVADASAPEVSTGEGGGIVLKPDRSGLRLVEHIANADQLDFGAAFEPWPDQVDVAQRLLRFLEDLHPLSFESVHEYDHSIRNSAARRLEVAAQVNSMITQLPQLKPEALHVLSGQYTILDKKVHWDNDEGCWYTRTNQREEVLSVFALRIAPISLPTLRIPVRGRPAPVSSSAPQMPTWPPAEDIPF